MIELNPLLLCSSGDGGQEGSESLTAGDKLPALQSAMAMAVAFAICNVGKLTTSLLGVQGGSLPCITAIVVALATLFPSHIGKLAPSGEALAVILMQASAVFCISG